MAEYVREVAKKRRIAEMTTKMTTKLCCDSLPKDHVHVLTLYETEKHYYEVRRKPPFAVDPGSTFKTQSKCVVAISA